MTKDYWTPEKRADERERRLAFMLARGEISEAMAHRYREDPTMPIHAARPGRGTGEADLVQILE